MKIFKKNSLQLYSETWSKDIWGLIDYEANDLVENEITIYNNGYIYRYIDDIIFSENEILEENYEKLFQITKNDKNIILNFNKLEFDDTENISSRNNAWFLFKPERMENQILRYKINEGEIIKIGRITIRIKEIRYEDYKNDFYLNQISKKSKNGPLNLSNDSNKNMNINSNRKINEIVQINNCKSENKKELELLRTEGNQTNITKKQANNKLFLKENKNKDSNKSYNSNIISKDIKYKNEKIIENNINCNINNIVNEKKYSVKKNKLCRICYMEEDDPKDNPLLNPCICSGSMKYIHYICLKHWINNKCYMKIENNKECSIFRISPVECELCKTKFPDLITKKGIIYNISEFKPDYKNYLVFESLTLDKNKNKYNYVVSLDEKNEKNKKIYVGRERESDVLFSDISVSRTHCIIFVENKNIYIYDNDSTFATLVLLQTPTITLVENLALYIQIGRTFFNLKAINKNKSSFFCCNATEKPNNKYYFEQNEKYIFYRKKTTMLNLDNIDNYKNDNEELNKSKINNNNSSINIKIVKIKKNNDNKIIDDEEEDNKNKMYNYINTDRGNNNDKDKNSYSVKKNKNKDKKIIIDNFENLNNEENTKTKEEKKNINIFNKKVSKDINNSDKKFNDNSNNQSKSIYVDEDN